ncbi:MAG: hypothetical protein ACRD1R_10070 [Acidobacteriota bacterium]
MGRGAAGLGSDDYFAGLGVRSGVGRVLEDEQEQPAVVVLSHRWWRDRFASDLTRTRLTDYLEAWPKPVTT